MAIKKCHTILQKRSCTISNIINGKRALKNLTIEVGAKLTDYVDQLQRKNED